MSRTSLTTPCPAQTTLNPSHRRISSFELFGEDTANIDYTRAIDQPLTGIKPRRRSMMGGPAVRAAKKAPVTIFEDVAEDEELVLEEKSNIKGKTLLGKPPAKMAQRQQGVDSNASFGAGRRTSIVEGARVGEGANRRDTLGPFRNMSIDDEEIKSASEAGSKQVEPALRGTSGNGTAKREIGGATIKKNPRRQTIFMPEDTTVMTIHPGAINTSRLDDTFQLPQHPQHTRPATNIASDEQKAARRPRHSLAVPPKRLPLRESPKSANGPSWDVAGANTGKENIPPGADTLEKCFKKLNLSKPSEPRDPPPPRSSLLAPTAASRHKQSIVPRNYTKMRNDGLHNAQARPTKQNGLRHDRIKDLEKQRRVSIIGYPPHKPSAPVSERTSFTSAAVSEIHAHSTSTTFGPRRTSPKVPIVTVDEEKKQIRSFIASKRNDAQIAKLKQYPVLSGDLSQPDLYEDGWLAYQEVALTEVVNEIFRANAVIHTTSGSPKSLRDQMIDIYNQREISLLHRRLQASLEYGALAQPSTSVKDHIPSQDIGLRKRLMSLFLDNYDSEALVAAAQVVAGREMPRGADHVIHGVSLDPNAGKRPLAAFLETFFVCVADVGLESNLQFNDQVDLLRWRKTMTRGLMLIWLLDQAKTSGAMSEEVNLFRSSSIKKSSAAVLDSFTTLLIPSVGDASRALKHMSFEVSHTQDPLDEVEYIIKNIATDLRDGILLTHLVEVLVHKHAERAESNALVPEEVTVRLPDGRLLVSQFLVADGGKQRNRVLSQHLMMPCTSDSQRAYNVQIALSALSGHSIDGNNMVALITAQDIVNGHREKTLSLLWSLVSVYGLRNLVNWHELKTDIVRHGGAITDTPRPGEEEAALKFWAESYASKAGVNCRNLTTAFADGKIYAAILDSFSSYLPGGKVGGMAAQLTALGCSKAFADKLTSSIGLIPSYQTTVSNLAFLASRLLPLAHKHNAAVVLQRAFRKRCERVEVWRRIKLMRLAHDCAKIVQTRNKIVNAATILQRAWRAVVDRRIRKLNGEVEVFQALAKGWASRNKASRTVFAAGW